MLYHAGTVFGSPGAFYRGYLFVDFFFLLSGFVLTLSAEERMDLPGGSTAFLRKRIIRLWPLSALGTLAGTLAVLITNQDQNLTLTVPLALLMIPALAGSGQLFPLNGPQWSLFYEVLANLGHALVLRRLNQFGLAIVVAVSALALAATVLHAGSNTLGPFSFNWWLALPRIAFSYTLGVWFARRWAAGPHTAILSWKLALLLPVLGVVSLGGLPLTPAWGDLVVVIGLFPVLFWGAAVANVPARHQAWLSQLGAISFPLYALHLPLLQAVAHFGQSAPMMILGILGTFGTAWLTDRLLSVLTRGGVRRKPAGVRPELA